MCASCIFEDTDMPAASHLEITRGNAVHSPSALGATDDARRHKSATRPRLSPPQHLHVALGTPLSAKRYAGFFGDPNPQKNNNCVIPFLVA